MLLLILFSIYYNCSLYFDVCFNGNLNMTDLVCMRYIIYRIMNNRTKAPMINSHVLNNIRSLISIGCNYNATITFPKIDINVPKYLCAFFNENISILNLSVTISYRSLNPIANWITTHPHNIQDNTNYARSIPYIFIPSGYCCE